MEIQAPPAKRQWLKLCKHCPEPFERNWKESWSGPGALYTQKPCKPVPHWRRSSGRGGSAWGTARRVLGAVSGLGCPMCSGLRSKLGFTRCNFSLWDVCELGFSFQNLDCQKLRGASSKRTAQRQLSANLRILQTKDKRQCRTNFCWLRKHSGMLWYASVADSQPGTPHNLLSAAFALAEQTATAGSCRAPGQQSPSRSCSVRVRNCLPELGQAACPHNFLNSPRTKSGA